jgi:hypothetical protein
LKAPKTGDLRHPSVTVAGLIFAIQNEVPSVQYNCPGRQQMLRAAVRGPQGHRRKGLGKIIGPLRQMSPSPACSTV